MSLFTIQNNIDVITNLYVKLFKPMATGQDILTDLEKHPDYPSLLSISDILASIGLDNAAYHIEANELIDVPVPFIAHTGLPDCDFVIVEQVEPDHALITSQLYKRRKIKLQQLQSNFKGVVLIVEAEASVAGRKNGDFSLINIIKPILPLAGLTVLALVLLITHVGRFTSASLPTVFLVLIKLAGVLTSTLLLIQSIDKNNPLVQRLCQSGTKTNCNAILSSNAAQAFWGLSWSEIGFFYFAGTLTALLFNLKSALGVQVIAWLNLAALPYTVYSIYYQANVARQWCVLCSMVQLLLWLEFFFVIPSLTLPFTAFTTTGTINIACSLLIPLLLWLLLKPLLQAAASVQPLKSQLRQFKYNRNVLEHMLAEQARYTQPDENWSIVLGNVEAEKVLIVVSNPYCQPCSKAHLELEEVMSANPDLQVRLIFTANDNDIDRKAPVVKHLLSLYKSTNPDTFARALSDWYAQHEKSYETWAARYLVPMSPEAGEQVNHQHNWCNMAEITSTPTVLLNGRKLPKGYRLTDLKYMLT